MDDNTRDVLLEQDITRRKVILTAVIGSLLLVGVLAYFDCRWAIGSMTLMAAIVSLAVRFTGWRSPQLQANPEPEG